MCLLSMFSRILVPNINNLNTSKCGVSLPPLCPPSQRTLYFCLNKKNNISFTQAAAKTKTHTQKKKNTAVADVYQTHFSSLWSSVKGSGANLSPGFVREPQKKPFCLIHCSESHFRLFQIGTCPAREGERFKGKHKGENV